MKVYGIWEQYRGFSGALFQIRGTRDRFEILRLNLPQIPNHGWVPYTAGWRAWLDWCKPYRSPRVNPMVLP